MTKDRDQGQTTEDEIPRTKGRGTTDGVAARIERIVLGPSSFVPGRSSTVRSRQSWVPRPRWDAQQRAA